MATERERPSPRDSIVVDAYDQMRGLARRRLHRMGSQSIQATELVNETFLRIKHRRHHWDDRKQLFGLAARAMRDILVERTRARASKKRGGDWQRVEWESAPQVADKHPEELMMLDEALSRLFRRESKYAQVVDLMFFAGLTGDETARALGVSPSTVDRRWRLARAWLYQELAGNQS